MEHISDNCPPGDEVTILAIESSCDETSASVCRNGKILSNIIANQSVHEKYGGVVPELELVDPGSSDRRLPGRDAILRRVIVDRAGA